MTDRYHFVEADKDLFAVYQTIYSRTDAEMWYDWTARLNDTKGGGTCWFVCRGDQKIGGVLLEPERIAFPFLIDPFDDRTLFWRLVLRFSGEMCDAQEVRLRSLPECDVRALTRFGGEVWRPRRIMCRPTDRLAYTLDGRFILQTPTEADIPEMAEAQRRSFSGGIAYRMSGEESVQEIADTMRACYRLYQSTGTWHHSAVVRRAADGRIVGGCVAGVHPGMVNGFSYLLDMFVCPEHRRMGLGRAMLRHSLSEAHRDAPAMKLHVIIGNPAETLYRETGFVAGPSFTDMKYRFGAY